MHLFLGIEKHRIQGEQNQSVATLVEEGFLGSLGTVEVSVSPDMGREVIRVEASWEKRLRTHHPPGLNEN
jgi:hypothetical protein